MKCMVHLGYENAIPLDYIRLVLNINSRPVIRLIDKAKADNKYINLTCGRKARSAILDINGYVIICALSYNALMKRIEESNCNNYIKTLE